MATQPEISPDTIEPQSPPEISPTPQPSEDPFFEPPEVEPSAPDEPFPDPDPPEMPPLE
jgi:hypothetical protein